MCDTMVVLPHCSGDGSLLFAKNSDREPNEPHIIVKIPRRKIEAGEKINCTYISVDNSGSSGKYSNEAILFKPSWIWGAEMGVNEKGVVIGNEAVFTREKVEARALLGMDILRLALELCSSAKEAVAYIAELTEKYGQGGKAGYTENLKYHNSYIIADQDEAYILETAGRQWVYEKVKDIRSISNSLSIRSSYDGCSDRLVENALSKGWCRSGEEFDFKKCYESKLYLFFTKGDVRRRASEDYLKARSGSLNTEDMRAVLRSHGGREEVAGFRTGSMDCLCMHAGGGLVTSQTTGSFIVRLKDGGINIWATGSSIPCISVFKPIWFTSDISGENSEAAEAFWKEAEEVHRRILEGSIGEAGSYIRQRDRLEEELIALASEAKTPEEQAKLTRYAFNSEKSLLTELLLESEGKQPEGRGGIFYKAYWRKQNRLFRDKR